MTIEIRCDNLGFACMCILRGKTEEEVLEALMHHIAFDHDGDWYDMEEVYDKARGNMHWVAA